MPSHRVENQHRAGGDQQPVHEQEPTTRLRLIAPEELQAGVAKLNESSQKMGAAMYAAAEADSAAAGGSTGSTGEADDDVVDAEIVDESGEGGEQ